MLSAAQQQIFTKAVEAMAAMTGKPVLYGPNGDAIRPTVTYSLRRDAAKRTGSLKNWNPQEVFSNQVEARERSDIVKRSVDLSNNDPHAAGIIDTFATTVIGSGLYPMPMIDAEAMGMAQSSADRLESAMSAVFNRWAPFADAGQRMHFGHIQYLSKVSMMRYGEYFCLLPMIKDDPIRPYLLACQLINPMRVKTPVGKSQDPNIRDGVLSSGTQVTTWYLALFSDDHTPAASDTYSTPGFTEADGYDETTRPQWQEAGVSSKSITNSANKATFTICIDASIGFGGLTPVGELQAGDERDATAGLGINEIAGRSVEYSRGIDVSIGFGEESGISGQVEKNSQSGIGLGETAGVSIEFARGIAAGLSFGEFAGGFNYSAWVRANLSRAVFRYHARITGVADGLVDCDLLGLKSFQFRRRSESPSYLSLSLVYSDSLLAAISARANGEIVLDMAAIIDGAESLKPMSISLNCQRHHSRRRAGKRLRDIQ